MEPIKVLIVDDDRDDVEATADMLKSDKRAQYIVRKAYTVEEAANVLSGFDVEVVLLDWRMPPDSGAALLIQMRDGNVSAPVVVLTGLDAHEVEEEARSLGAVDFLNKRDLSTSLLRRVLTPLARPEKPVTRLLSGISTSMATSVDVANARVAIVERLEQVEASIKRLEDKDRPWWLELRDWATANKSTALVMVLLVLLAVMLLTMLSNYVNVSVLEVLKK